VLKESAEMSYPGFFAKYGQEKMLSCAFAFGVAAGIGVEVMQGYSAGQYDFGPAALFGLCGGVFGMRAAYISHESTDKYCAKNKMGVTRGVKLVKQMQAASYVVVLGAYIGVGQAEFFDIKQIDVEDKAETISHENNRQPQSIKQIADQHGLVLAG
jgi:hypothetical protein